MRSRARILVEDIALETSFDGPVVDAIIRSLSEFDPGARAVPYTMFGGTDAKAFAGAWDSRLRLRAAKTSANAGVCSSCSMA